MIGRLLCALGLHAWQYQDGGRVCPRQGCGLAERMWRPSDQDDDRAWWEAW